MYLSLETRVVSTNLPNQNLAEDDKFHIQKILESGVQRVCGGDQYPPVTRLISSKKKTRIL